MSKKRGPFMHLLRLIGLVIVIAAGVASILATGGGGGGGGSGVVSSSGGTGSVALYVADGDADSYEQIYIWITRVELLPANGSGAAPVLIYQSPDPQGYKVDLLSYREEDFFLTLKPIVPAGWYDKVRLYVSNIESVGGPCDLELDIKLPSGRIDLNPREPFEVKKGEALAIRLDIDANKSINLHPAGKSGKCIFRPVVFVDIEPVKLRSACPEILTGQITQIIDTSSAPGINGFVLTLPDGRGNIEVLLSESTAIFDQEGLPGTSADLKLNDSVWVRGRIDSYGKLSASVVIVGKVLAVDGVAQSSVNIDDQFIFLPNAGEAISGEFTVQLFDGNSLVLVGCDKIADWGAIQPNRKAKVVGKYDTHGQVFRGIVVFLKELEISGSVVSVNEQDGGLTLTIQTNGTTEVTVYVPSNAPVYLEGDGEFPRALLCEGREVRVIIDPAVESPLTAKQVRVTSETLEGTVLQGTNPYNRVLLVKPSEATSAVYVGVQPYATLLDLRNGKYEPIGISDIGPGDEVKCFGVQKCPDDSTSPVDFYAFVILVIN
jgi:hypothetical protein